MTKTFDSAAWPMGEEWPPEPPPPAPTIPVTLTVQEVEHLIEDHVIAAENASLCHSHGLEHFHTVRADYLRQQLADVPTPEMTGGTEGNA